MNFTKNTKIRTAAVTALLIISIFAQGLTAAAAEKTLVPMGSAVGIQIYTKGVLVVGLSATGGGTEPSPGAVAGLVPGDLITALGGDKITNGEDFRAAAAKLTAEPVSLRVQRGDESLQMTVTPKMTAGVAELGIWLRDNVSGIGTLTYYDPETGSYGGLGHGINDVDSGVLMPLGKGSILNASITEIKKGCAGVPGELCGSYDLKNLRGSILKNTPSGIFGKLEAGLPQAEAAIPLAKSSEIELGKATILANLQGSAAEEYEVEIARVYRGDEAGRSMLICVKDARLLERAGGIVQGMSGSPIIQNGKLIGAVTHVFINDPTRGYGISIENMLNAAENAKAG
ncbi:MAG: SpoIVB peptidase [Oscillospiraceae bacterium]